MNKFSLPSLSHSFIDSIKPFPSVRLPRLSVITAPLSLSFFNFIDVFLDRESLSFLLCSSPSFLQRIVSPPVSFYSHFFFFFVLPLVRARKGSSAKLRRAFFRFPIILPRAYVSFLFSFLFSCPVDIRISHGVRVLYLASGGDCPPSSMQLP